MQFVVILFFRIEYLRTPILFLGREVKITWEIKKTP